MPAIQSNYSQYLVPGAEQRARAYARRAKWFAAPPPAPKLEPRVLEPSANFPWQPLRKLLAEVASKHQVHPSLLASPRRTKYLVVARREFIYRAIAETRNSLSVVGRFIGRDHTTILHHLRSYCRMNNMPDPRETA